MEHVTHSRFSGRRDRPRPPAPGAQSLKKIPGFTDADIAQATNCKILWKVPNAFHLVGPAIDHGTPVVLQENQEISRSLRALAAALAEASTNSDGSGLDLVYSQDKADAKAKAVGRPNLSPIRAGH